MNARRQPLQFNLDELTSQTPAMQRCLKLAREAARSDLPLLLQGETGTGKTLLAHAIHLSSLRSDSTFVSFNASAMTDTLLESQLFGHEKGAFTGANRKVIGKFPAAHEGTLFLDEIADMSPTAQAKILRAVEYGKFEPLGAEEMRYADVRVLSATNRPLREWAQQGEFRQDLYHRLNGITLRIPALRDRREDLPALIAMELQLCAQRADKTITALHPDAFNKLIAWDWPGNLRELHRVIQTVVLFADGVVGPEHVMLDDSWEAPPTPAAKVTEPAIPETMATEPDATLDAAILRHVVAVYESTGRNKVKTAELLGISRARLYRKLAALGEA